MKTSKVSVALKDSGLVDLKGLQLQRTKTDYQVIDTFTLPKNLNFEHQYASLYYQRLTQLKKASCLTAKKLWPDCPPFLESLLHIQEGVYCCVAGTLYRETLLKANTIDEFIAERALVVQPKRDKYISKGDVIYLEDESGRIALSGSLPYDSALTGIVIIVCGKEVNQSFEVEKYTFPGMAEQVKPPLNRLAGSEKKVCLISGIEMEANYRHNNSLQLLIDYLLGFLGDEKQQKESSKIARLIVAGNLLSRTATVEAAKIVQSSKKESLKDEIVTPLNNLDAFFAQLASGIPITLLPGENDPSSVLLPQQSLHWCLFPSMGNFPNSWECVTNPYNAVIDNIEFLGTSGQNVDDVYKYIPTNDRLRILKQMLYWRHLAPTSPDTLGCYPYAMFDPFIIERTPHIFFAGNQPEFKKEIIDEGGVHVTIISVPSFSKTKVAVIVDLYTLDASAISFA